jgi:hypothetical protein
MQPYYYPYVGYFELIKAVDKFVFLNNVQYIRRGWVNRNRIRWNNDWKYLTVPIVKCDRATLIQDVKISGNEWKRDHLHSLMCSYTKTCILANHPSFQFLASVETDNLCQMLMDTIIHTARYLGIKTEFFDSRDYPTTSTKQYRLIDICKQLKADVYVNAIGGAELYDPQEFEAEGIKLEFMQPTTYRNKLSILDLMLGDNLKTISNECV